MSTKLFVANLSSRIRTRELKEKFEDFGSVKDVTIKEGRDTFAFIEYHNPEDAEEAIKKLNGEKLLGRTIRVEYSKNSRRSGGEDKCFVC